MALMHEVLPIGLAVIERAKKGGITEVVEGFSSAKDPFQELKIEGDSAAISIREKLDQFRPGLGNPVIEVEVAVEESQVVVEDKSLEPVLRRVDESLERLKDYLKDNQS